MPELNLPGGVDSLRIGFLGAGRLGTALAWALAGAGLRVTAASSRTRADAQTLADGIPGCQAVDAQALPTHCDLVFVATTDSAIAAAVSAVRWRSGMSVVHCSGATEVDALAAAQREGASIGGFHPLQTFGDPAAAVASLPGCTITVEADGALADVLNVLCERLHCRVNRLPPGMRGRYHAAAGYTSQFINALFSQAAEIWSSWGADETAALEALLPLARGTLASIGTAGIARGMPGPVSRGDVASVRKHVASLETLGEPTVAFYRVLCGTTIPLARRAGGIGEDAASEFRRALS